MAVTLDAGSGRFPAVIWVDADRRGEAINLIFGTRAEGQAAALRVTLTPPQWENLKFPSMVRRQREAEVVAEHFRKFARLAPLGSGHGFARLRPSGWRAMFA
jgi:hypothetical protein